VGPSEAEDFGPPNMTKIELNRFQNALKGRQAELENEIRGRGALAIEMCPDEFDRIQHGQERDLAIGTLDRNSKLLRAVRAALGRIDAGTFGICTDCEEVISMKRLVALPWTASCIVCQEAADSLAGQPWSVSEELLVSAD
jgi:RNA polymerase-binding transcription factor